MSTQAAARESTLPVGSSTTGTHSTAWWGMVILLFNEAVIFASLLASYFYLRFNSVLWPPQGVYRPELTLSSINTVILISSSLVMQWSVIGIAHGNRGRMRAGFALAFVL